MAGLKSLEELSAQAATECPGVPLDEWAGMRNNFAEAAMPTTMPKRVDHDVHTRAPGAGPGLNMDLT